MLGADGHRQAPVEDVPNQGDQHELLFQDVQHLPDGGDGVEGGRHAGRPAHEHLRGLIAGAAPAQGAGGQPDHAVHDGVVGTGHDHRVPDRLAGEMGRQMGGGRRHLGRAGLVWPFEGVLVHRPTGEYGHDHRHLRGQADQLHRADPGRVGDLADNHRRVVGEIRKGTGWCRPAASPAPRGRWQRRPGSAGTGPGPAGLVRRWCPRRTGSPCRWESGRRWCGAGPGSPPARGRPSRCAPWPRRRKAPECATPPRTRPAGRSGCIPPLSL